MGNLIKKILATNFSTLVHLHCYSQVASVFTFNSDNFVKLLLLKRLRSIETKNLLVTIVVPKLQSDVQLEHCIVPNVPISPQNTILI